MKRLRSLVSSSAFVLLAATTAFVPTPLRADSNPVLSLNDEVFMGKITYLFFGFTTCGDVCPLTLGRLLKLQRAILEAKAEDRQVVFATIDPHDTAESVAAFVDRHAPGIKGLIGSPEALSQLYLTTTGRGMPTAVTQHSPGIFVIGTDGKPLRRLDADVPTSVFVRAALNEAE